jgi:L-threonylcarbamoyladenylate synthase
MIERLFWDENLSIERLAAVLRDGGIAIGSSDTVFGLISNLKCSSKNTLDAIKKRFDKPYLILIPGGAKLENFVDPAGLSKIEALAKQCWPGPVTLICKAHPDLPAFMQGPEGTIALRMPDHEGLQKLLTHFEGLFSTSANISGQPVPDTVEGVDPAILARCAALVLNSRTPNPVRPACPPKLEERRGEHAKGQIPSTILDCTDDEIKVVRQGAFPVDKILGKLG